MHIPRLNERARNLSAQTTLGNQYVADYQGEWPILFSRPADFAPTRSTEFIGLVKADLAIL
jgi:alkyl hydroperoxide reductase subunit AhpC